MGDDRSWQATKWPPEKRSLSDKPRRRCAPQRLDRATRPAPRLRLACASLVLPEVFPPRAVRATRQTQGEARSAARLRKRRRSAGRRSRLLVPSEQERLPLAFIACLRVDRAACEILNPNRGTAYAYAMACASLTHTETLLPRASRERK